jgi:holo-[acyl-carrier protein] synthase
MIVGIGVDVASLERIRELLERHGERFLKRIYTQGERDYCEKFKDPIPHLAARFAAKEAAYKALGGVGPIRWTQMEISNDDRGKPSLAFHKEVAKIANEAGVVRTHVTLAHDAGVAVANVVLEAS